MAERCRTGTAGGAVPEVPTGEDVVLVSQVVSGSTVALVMESMSVTGSSTLGGSASRHVSGCGVRWPL